MEVGDIVGASDDKSNVNNLNPIFNTVGQMGSSIETLEAQIKTLEVRLNEQSQEIKELKKGHIDKPLLQCVQRLCSKSTKKPDRRGKYRNLTIDVDDSIHMYLDGVEVTCFEHAEQWNESDTVPLPYKTKVIAVRGTNLYADAGIVGSTEDGFILTNSSWKCINHRIAGWQNVTFDDSLWPPAYQIYPSTDKPIDGIRPDAYWIWTKNYTWKTGDKNVYCRKRL